VAEKVVGEGCEAAGAVLARNRTAGDAWT